MLSDEQKTEFQRVGGDAFPNGLFPGMSLRDYFAAKAMQGIIPTLQGRTLSSDIAADAYKIADAMLAERVKKGGAR